MAGVQKGGDYSANTAIIPLGGRSGKSLRPRSIINAISEIQQYFVIESQGQEIPAEFLTLEGSLDLFKVGMRSGFNEGLLIVLLFPVFSFYLLPFVLDPTDLAMKIMFEMVPYLALVINTLLCIYLSRYYVGTITRRAINSLFVGRGMMLILKGFLIYLFYQVVFRLSTPENVWAVAQKFGDPEKLYYGYLTILPQLIPVATETAIFMGIAAVVPYGAAYVLDVLRQRRIKRNRQVIGKS